MNGIPLLGKLVLELKLFDFCKRDGYWNRFILLIFVGVEGMSALFKDIFIVVSWKEHSLQCSCGKMALRPCL